MKTHTMKQRPLFADLTKRIQLREVENVAVASGGVETSYTVRATVWGAIKPLPTAIYLGFYVREVLVQNQPTHTIRLRINTELGITRQGLQGNMFLYSEDGPGSKGRSFRILSSIDRQDRGLEVEILAQEIEIQYGRDRLT